MEAIVAMAVVLGVLASLLQVSELALKINRQSILKTGLQTSLKEIQQYFNDTALCTAALGSDDPLYYLTAPTEDDEPQNISSLLNKNGQVVAQVGFPQYGYRLTNMSLRSVRGLANEDEVDDKRFLARVDLIWEYFAPAGEESVKQEAKSRSILLLARTDQTTDPPGRVTSCLSRISNETICSELKGTFDFTRNPACNIPTMAFALTSSKYAGFVDGQKLITNGFYTDGNANIFGGVWTNQKDDEGSYVHSLYEGDKKVCTYFKADDGTEYTFGCPPREAWDYYGVTQTLEHVAQSSLETSVSDCSVEKPETPVRVGMEIEWTGYFPEIFEGSHTRVNMKPGNSDPLTVDPTNIAKSRTSSRSTCAQGAYTP